MIYHKTVSDQCLCDIQVVLADIEAWVHVPEVVVDIFTGFPYSSKPMYHMFERDSKVLIHREVERAPCELP